MANDATNPDALPQGRSARRQALADSIPLFTAYVPVAMSFGLIAVQSGLTTWEATLVSALVYAGAAQFLFVAMTAAGAAWWLIIAMTLLVNARFMVYGPAIAPYVDHRKRWFLLAHGLTDQMYGLAQLRLPQLAEKDRVSWFAWTSVLSWLSWVLGTTLGAAGGAVLVTRWPAIGGAMAFALPALALVLIAPRFTSRHWTVALIVSVIAAAVLKITGYANIAIPAAGLAGTLAFFALGKSSRVRQSS